VVCAGSFGAALALAFLSAISPPQSKQSTLRKRRLSVEQAAAAQEEGETIRCAHAKHFNASFWLICAFMWHTLDRELDRTAPRRAATV
jgi:hypothetical protein